MAMGRPSKYKTAAEIEQAIDDYFAKVDAENKANPDKACPPIYEELLLHLDITKNTWDSYINPEYTENMTEEIKRNKQALSDAVKKAEHRLSAELAKFGAKYPNRASLVIFFLKQKHYGGYTDKQEIEHKDMKIDISINGVKNNPFA